PFVRGVTALAESMALGLRALTWAAAQQLDEHDEDGQEIPPPTKGQIAGTAIFALAFFTVVFIVVPAIIAKLAGHALPNRVSFNAFEGALRLAMFIGYIVLLGRLADVRRVFEYHGAEHKAIAAYENGVELTPARAQTFTTQHVRCGTNFLLVVLVLTILSH